MYFCVLCTRMLCISQEVSQLMDMEYFQAEARKGHSIDTR